MAIAALRYNNPFDVSLPIAGWDGGGDIAGVQGQPGFGAFPDMATGYQAGVHRLNSYITGQNSHGAKRTIKDLNSVYATDPNWASGVAAHSGLDPTAPLDPSNADQMKQLQYGVLAQEMGPQNAAQIFAQHHGPDALAAINSAAGVKKPQGGGALSFAGNDDGEEGGSTPANASPTSGALSPANSGALNFGNNDGSGKQDRFSIGDLFGASDDTKAKLHGLGARLVQAAAAASSGVNPAQSAQLNTLSKSLIDQNKTDYQYTMGPNGQVVKINKDTGEVNFATLPGGGKGQYHPIMGKDDNGNPVYHGRVNLSTNTFEPVAGGQTTPSTPIGGDPELTGQDRYDSLTTNEKSQMDAWRNGTGIQPSQYAMRNPKMAKLVDAANAIGIDMTKYGERQALLKGMAAKTPTSAGGQFISAPTVTDHLTNVANDYLNLHNSSGGGWSTGAAVTNAIKDMRGGVTRESLQTSANRNTDTASKEIVSFLTRGHGGVSERQDTHDALYMPTKAPEVQAAALEAYRKQVADRFYELADGAKGSAGDHPEVLKAIEAFKAKDAALQEKIQQLRNINKKTAPDASTGGTKPPLASFFQ